MNNSISLTALSKSYQVNKTLFYAIDAIDLTIKQGDFVSIIGKSGSGKSTLLNLMSAIDQPSSGQVVVNDVDISHMKAGLLDTWRGRNIGLVFQFFQLIPTLTVLENIMLPMDFCKTIAAKQRRTRARALLGKVGLVDKENKFPAILSGGEKQRVAIARSLANDAPIILADEPTGNLDSKTAMRIFALFEELNRQGKTVIIVSHDPCTRDYAQRTVTITDGEIVSALPVREGNSYV